MTGRRGWKPNRRILQRSTVLWIITQTIRTTITVTTTIPATNR